MVNKVAKSISETIKTDDEEPMDYEYTDHALDAALLESQQRLRQGEELPPSANDPFPIHLHYMLERLEAQKKTDIASWAPHGRAFLVHNRDLFVQQILPKFFKQTLYSSFQRQLSLYGFKRITRGPDEGAYYNPEFLKISRTFARNIRRTKVKNTGPRKKAAPDLEPNLYTMMNLADAIVNIDKMKDLSSVGQSRSSTVNVLNNHPIGSSTPPNALSLLSSQTTQISASLAPSTANDVLYHQLLSQYSSLPQPELSVQPQVQPGGQQLSLPTLETTQLQQLLQRQQAVQQFLQQQRQQLQHQPHRSQHIQNEHSQSFLSVGRGAAATGGAGVGNQLWSPAACLDSLPTATSLSCSGSLPLSRRPSLATGASGAAAIGNAIQSQQQQLQQQQQSQQSQRRLPHQVCALNPSSQSFPQSSTHSMSELLENQRQLEALQQQQQQHQQGLALMNSMAMFYYNQNQNSNNNDTSN